MESSYLYEFVVLADAGKFSAAAHQLHISQSVLSRHIQAMERELGHPLFVRNTRSMELSAYGGLYYPHAKRASEALREADDAIRDYEKRQEQSLLIGIVHNPELYHIPECILDFRQAHPELSLQIFEGSLKELRQQFSEGNIRIITMTFAPWEMPTNGFIPFGESRLVAVLPKDHPLAEYEKIPCRLLEEEHLLVPNQTAFTYRYLEHALQAEGIKPEIVYQGNTTGMASLVKAGMGVLIQEAELALLLTDPPLAIRELEPDISYIYGVEYAPQLSANEQLYVRHMQEILPKKMEARKKAAAPDVDRQAQLPH